MNAVELLAPDGKPSGAWMCGLCHRVETWNGTPALLPDPAMPWKGETNVLADHSEFSRQQAEHCCSGRCEVCGAGGLRSWLTACNEHAAQVQATADAAKEREAFAKAEARPDYTGPFLVGDRLVPDVAAAIEAHTWRGGPVPAYLWVPRRVKFHLNAAAVIDAELEDEHHEDAGDEIPAAALAELQLALDCWCERYGPVTYWEHNAEYVPVPTPPLTDELEGGL